MKRIPIFIHTPIISDKQFSCPFEKPYGYIYRITNQINGHYYIGKHEFHHPWLDKRYKGSGKLLKKAYEKYGIENFETIILEWTDKDNEELNRLEKLYISVFHANERPNYNISDGGDGGISGENNPMKRPENRKKMSERSSGENNPMYGDHRFAGENNPAKRPESRKKISENNPNKRPEVRKKKSEALKGRPFSEEHKEHLSEALKGKKRSDESKRKQSASIKGANHPRCKPVVQLTLSYEFVREYAYTSEVKQFGFGDPCEVSACCKGKKDSYKGFKWMYKTDYNKLMNN